MKIYLTIFLTLSMTINLFSQDCNEFKSHLESINNTFYPGHITDRFDTVFNANRAFIDYTISHLLEKPSDKCFISNRKLLRKLKRTYCDSLSIIVKDTLSDGKLCEMTLITGEKKGIKKLKIEINKHTLTIPQTAFNGFYDVNVCDNYAFFREVEVYESINQKYIYLYLYGGNAANTYFAKLIFSREKYLTKIISNYYPLSIHSSFRANFIGF